ncbi:MAG: hypothetical protein VKO65_05980 [Cyanobacteriota bacterium]|nr:hypothetical protein [Cyanobacteriota bacterium]
MPSGPTPAQHRHELRLRSVSWALLAAAVAGGLTLLAAALPPAGPPPLAGLEPALRAAGCGFVYGRRALQLQRVEPDDGHLQAGLVGAVCGIRSLAAPLVWPAEPAAVEAPLAWLAAAVPTLAAQWLPLWLPLIAAALVLPLALKRWPILRP